MIILYRCKLRCIKLIFLGVLRPEGLVLGLLVGKTELTRTFLDPRRSKMFYVFLKFINGIKLISHFI